jgi:hypothetical protein
VSEGDHTTDIIALVHFDAYRIGLDARGVDEATKGVSNGRDVVHKIPDEEAEILTFFYNKGFGAEVLRFAGIRFFDTGFIDHAALAVGPGDAIDPPGLIVREEVVQTLISVHYAAGERGRGDAAKPDVVIKVKCFHKYILCKNKDRPDFRIRDCVNPSIKGVVSDNNSAYIYSPNRREPGG